MRKILLSATLLALCSFAVVGQNPIVDNPSNKAYFGIRVGGDITCPGKISESNVSISAFKNGGGIEFGGIYNVPVVANFYIEPGVKLFYDTYSMKDEYFDIFEGNYNITGLTFKKFGMRIPVMAGYHFDFTDDVKVYVFTGPEFEIGFSAKAKLKGRNEEISESLYGDNGGMKRFDLVWGVGAGISYQHFYFGVNGGIGMLNMNDDSDGKFHENRVTFSIGYNF